MNIINIYLVEYSILFTTFYSQIVKVNASGLKYNLSKFKEILPKLHNKYGQALHSDIHTDN